MTPRQCQAARRLLGWSRVRLAAFAGLQEAVILAFERAERMPSSGQLEAVRGALEAEGIEFSPDEGDGLGVRWRTSQSEALERARYLRHQAAETRAAARKTGLRGEAARLMEVAREMEAQAAAIEAEFRVSRAPPSPAADA
jgi:transcriptional regulator with XRE-family HTH domain